MRIALVAWLLVAWLAAPTNAENAGPEDAKRAVILRLMELTRAAELGIQMRDSMLGQFKQMFPQVPAELWDEFGAVFDANELRDATIPIYERNFTLEELTGLVQFYESPLGRSLMSKMPTVMTESLALGNEIGRRQAEELIRRLKQRGFEPPQA